MSQEPSGRGKEERAASDGQAEDNEETEDNECWATTKAMDALEPDKIVVHILHWQCRGDWRAIC